MAAGLAPRKSGKVTTRRCARCGKEPESFSISFFNEDEICRECREIERMHPDYARARRIEREHLVGGDYGFPGIGLPDGYAEWAESMRRALA